MIVRDAGNERSREWAYVVCTIAAFVFLPEVRRVADWRGAYDPLNAFAVIPLIMLCPIAIFAFLRRRALRPSAFPLIAVIWSAGFAYALFVGAARGALVSGVYAAGQFVLPVVIGLWLLSRPEALDVSHKRLARWLLAFGAAAGLYGIYQFIFAPPWDTAWMQNIGAGSFGVPEPFGIRVFGVLNSPGTYALFLGAVILINLPYLTARSWVNLAATLVVLLGLLLSLVRSGWLAVLAGIVIFVCLSPKRLSPVLALTCIASLCVVSTLAFLAFIPNKDFSDKLLARFGTFATIGSDDSGAEREETSMSTLQSALQQPLGAGLGLTGGSSKLQSDVSALAGAPAGDIDNGFVSRFFEMGVVGFCAFVLACLLAILSTLRSYRRYASVGNVAMTQIIAACVAVEIAIFLLNLSGDDQQGILGVMFFIALALPMLAQPSVSGKLEPKALETLGGSCA